MDQIVIRAAQAEDIDAVACLWEALVDYHHRIDPELPSAAPQGAKRYARRLVDRIDDPTSCLLVADANGEVVGYVFGVIVDLAPEMFMHDASGFLADIYVSDSYRRQGIGRRLVEGLAAWFSEKGLRYFEWHVAARNEESVAFWHSVGGRNVMLRMRAEIDSEMNP